MVILLKLIDGFRWKRVSSFWLRSEDTRACAVPGLAITNHGVHKSLKNIGFYDSVSLTAMLAPSTTNSRCVVAPNAFFDNVSGNGQHLRGVSAAGLACRRGSRWMQVVARFLRMLSGWPRPVWRRRAIGLKHRIDQSMRRARL
jgi:hypothetical protein